MNTIDNDTGGGGFYQADRGYAILFGKMFDMRYHIASLVAVFLALTVGLLLGTLIVDQGLLADQQQALFKSIRADVNKINERNRELQTEVTDLRDFQKQVLPIAVEDRLADSFTTIVTLTTGRDELVNEVIQTLALAGAQTSRLSLDMKGVDLNGTTYAQTLLDLSGEDDLAGGELEKRFWRRVAAEVAGNESGSVLDDLSAAGLLSVDTTGIPSRDIVVFAADDRSLGSRDILFLDALAELDGVNVIAVESSEWKPSRIAAYKLRDVSTIDNVDTVPGKISLIYLLMKRDVTAHFGVKSAADTPMP